jgi:hypothetical protein
MRRSLMILACIALIGSAICIAAPAAANDVKIICDKGDKNQTFYQEAAAVHIIGHLECGEKVTVLYQASDSTSYRILRKPLTALDST